MLDVSYNYLTEDSFRPDVFADMRTLETLNLQRNRFVLWYDGIKELTSALKQKNVLVDELRNSHCE